MCLVVACAVVQACAEKPPEAPVLRIDAGAHTAKINYLATDAAQRIIVTGSDDKTVRVWDATDGRLLQVLRPPLGPGFEGVIYAVAMAPDGSAVACGGWTGLMWDGSNAVYIFDRISGALRRRISGLPRLVSHLAWSPDGRFLAVTMGGGGLRVYRVDDGTLAARDDYGSESWGADFDRSGRLVTACFDRYVRLYDAQFHPTMKKRLHDRPYSVRFSSDGSRIAVGSFDSPQVDVLSATDLLSLYTPDVTGLKDGNLKAVAWSADGRLLYAAGRWERNGIFPIRRWEDGGRGRASDLECGAGFTIMDLCPFGDGRLAWASSSASWGALNADGSKALLIAPPKADLQHQTRGLCLSATGDALAFTDRRQSREVINFDLNTRSVSISAGPARNLQPPLTEVGRSKVTDWDGAARLNGVTLTLPSGEPSHSVAFAPDGHSLLLGTGFFLRCFDAQGTALWHVPAPDSTWAVNVSADNKLAVAAFGDGTIRWYRMRDGKELLALFPHADRKRWILWTPSGYYDASPGGEDLIGWHLNHGKESAADFFAASRFRSMYHRPDVVDRILTTTDEAEALRQANAASGRKSQEVSIERRLPPVVKVTSPQDGSEVSTPDVTIRYTVRTPSGEAVTAMKVLIDGRPLAAARDLNLVSTSGTEQTTHVAMPPRTCTVSIIASNRFGTSEPSSVLLRWHGAVTPTATAASSSAKGRANLYVLAVGVARYPRADWLLRYPAKDALDFTNVLRAQKGHLYRDVVTRVLTDQEATKDNIVDGLDWVRQQTSANDVAVVFLSGHGMNDDNGSYFFVPVNFDPQHTTRTGVAASDIRRTLSQVAGKALFFFDSCHAGGALGGPRPRDTSGFINELISAENGTVVFGASQTRQAALEDERWGNGAFTKAVVEGLGGRADFTHSGRITVTMLDLYISERVKELTGGQQIPTSAKPSMVSDFPIAVMK